MLTEYQIDALKEVVNIGSGQAASRLADLLHRDCRVSVPKLIYADVGVLKSFLDVPDSFAVALYMSILGDIPATMVIIMRRVHAQAMVREMTHSTVTPIGWELDFTAQFALKQIAELLTQSFSNAISRFLGTKALYAMPEIAMQTWSSVLATGLRKAAETPDETLVAIYSDFFDHARAFEGRFVYLLNTRAQQVVLTQINRLLK